MKLAVFVDSPDSVPEKVRRDMLVVSSYNYEDVYSQYTGMNVKLIMFVGPSVDAVRLLKFVEDYEGDLAVYFSGKVSTVMASRFNYVENRRKYQRKEFPELGRVEKIVQDIKEVLK
jgi:signal peptidase I